MALKFSAWLAVAALSCALVWYGLSDFRRKTPPPNDAPWNTLGEWSTMRRPSYPAERRLAEANDRAWVLTLRDSVLRQRVAPSSDSLSVVVDPDVASRTSYPIDS